MIECSTQIYIELEGFHHQLPCPSLSSWRFCYTANMDGNMKQFNEHFESENVYYLDFSLLASFFFTLAHAIWPFQAIFSRTSKHAASLLPKHHPHHSYFRLECPAGSKILKEWNYDEEKMREWREIETIEEVSNSLRDMNRKKVENAPLMLYYVGWVRSEIDFDFDFECSLSTPARTLLSALTLQQVFDQIKEVHQDVRDNLEKSFHVRLFKCAAGGAVVTHKKSDVWASFWILQELADSNDERLALFGNMLSCVI